MILLVLKWIGVFLIVAVYFTIIWNLLNLVPALKQTQVLGFTLAWIFALWLALPLAQYTQRRIPLLKVRW